MSISPDALRKFRIVLVLCTFINLALLVGILAQTGFRMNVLGFLSVISAVALFVTYILSVSGKNNMDKIVRFFLFLVPVGFTLYYGISGASVLSYITGYGRCIGCQLLASSVIIACITGFLALIEVIITVSQPVQ
ncbi:hypothetical protein BGZ95_005150, partial [Linnemannia exigua]